MNCFKCKSKLDDKIDEYPVGDFVYCFNCVIEFCEKFMKIKKRITKWHNERFDTNHEEMADMLSKFWKLMK